MRVIDRRWHALLLTILAWVSIAAWAEPTDPPTAADLEAMGAETVAELLERNPDLAASLDAAAGYVAIAMASTKLPGVGAGTGYGVVIDKARESHSYIQVTQFEAGGGIGAQKYRLLIVLDKPRLIDRFIAGGWHYEGSAELESSVAEGAAGAAFEGRDYKVFKLTDKGGAATVTVRAMNAVPFEPTPSASSPVND